MEVVMIMIILERQHIVLMCIQYWSGKITYVHLNIAWGSSFIDIISYSTVVLYVGIMEVRGFWPRNLLQNQLNIMKAGQFCLSIAMPITHALLKTEQLETLLEGGAGVGKKWQRKGRPPHWRSMKSCRKHPTRGRNGWWTVPLRVRCGATAPRTTPRGVGEQPRTECIRCHSSNCLVGLSNLACSSSSKFFCEFLAIATREEELPTCLWQKEKKAGFGERGVPLWAAMPYLQETF